MLQWSEPPSPNKGPGKGPGTPPPMDLDRTINNRPRALSEETMAESIPSPTHPPTPNPWAFNRRRQTELNIDEYFQGPRDVTKHSKWPMFMQMHGSIMPKLVIPMIVVGAWSTLVCSITLLDFAPRVNLGIDSVLLTVTGFVVGLALSFRSSTAYERYAEGRRFWGTLTLNCHTLGRIIWFHIRNTPGDEKQSLLDKLTAMNLLVAFAVSLKHKLRFEPYTHYDDLRDLIDHLDTLGKDATESGVFEPKEPNWFKAVGERLGINFATSNPRKVVKRARSEGVALGNLPLEILCYLASYIDDKIEELTLPTPGLQASAWTALTALNDCMVNTERVANTPLPIAYSIAISQITWIYVLLLPFQLLPKLGWVTIPGNILAAYIILGLLFIGREVENPFGNDVNDLPLELFCAHIVEDMHAISSRPRVKAREWMASHRNKPLLPHSQSSYVTWAGRSDANLKKALRQRPLRSATHEQSMSRPVSVYTKGPTSRPPSRTGTTFNSPIASPTRQQPHKNIVGDDNV